MTDHLTQDQRDRWANRSLSPQELLRLDEHLAGCDSCREELLSAAPALEQIGEVHAALLNAANSPAHLSFELLIRYLEGELEIVDREATESHLALCPVCSGELDDMRRFRAEMSTYPARQYAYVKPAGLLERLALWRPTVRSVGVLAMASSAMIVIFAIATHAPLIGTPRGNGAPAGNLVGPGAAETSVDRYQTQALKTLHPQPVATKKSPPGSSGARTPNGVSPASSSDHR